MRSEKKNVYLILHITIFFSSFHFCLSFPSLLSHLIIFLSFYVSLSLKKYFLRETERIKSMNIFFLLCEAVMLKRKDNAMKWNEISYKSEFCFCSLIMCVHTNFSNWELLLLSGNSLSKKKTSSLCVFLVCLSLPCVFLLLFASSYSLQIFFCFIFNWMSNDHKNFLFLKKSRF